MNRTIGVVGLGYVGLPVAVEFSKKFSTIGFDINEKRINELKKGIDLTNEVDESELHNKNLIFTSDKEKLKSSDFVIVAVPTPIDNNNQPDFTPLIKASETVGTILQKGMIVVYESTVYPGATEEICIPILEKISGLKSNDDFHVGYSPERINPGDKINKLPSIVKVVSAQNAESLKIVSQTYAAIIDAGVHEATSIKVAEAAKVIENTQRDVNIALMNELALIFEKLNIKTADVLEAAGTKWNFLKFTPGLVGGHCIGVDPYYLTYKAQEVGYYPEVILAGRRINNNLSNFIATALVKSLIKQGKIVNQSKIGVLGLTFKENVPDLRNSKVFDLITELNEFGMEVLAYDPIINKENLNETNFTFGSIDKFKNLDAIIIAVAHDEFKNKEADYFAGMINKNAVIIDLKNVISENGMKEDVLLWTL